MSEGHRFVTVADPSVEVITFTRGDGSLEVVLSKKSGGAPTRINVPAPPKGLRIVTRRFPTGEVEVVYE